MFIFFNVMVARSFGFSKTGANIFAKAFANLRRARPVPKKIDRSILGFCIFGKPKTLRIIR